MPKVIHGQRNLERDWWNSLHYDYKQLPCKVAKQVEKDGKKLERRIGFQPVRAAPFGF